MIFLGENVPNFAREKFRLGQQSIQNTITVNFNALILEIRQSRSTNNNVSILTEQHINSLTNKTTNIMCCQVVGTHQSHNPLRHAGPNGPTQAYKYSGVPVTKSKNHSKLGGSKSMPPPDLFKNLRLKWCNLVPTWTYFGLKIVTFFQGTDCIIILTS